MKPYFEEDGIVIYHGDCPRSVGEFAESRFGVDGAYMGVRVCATHQIKDEPEPEEELEFDDDWEI